MSNSREVKLLAFFQDKGVPKTGLSPTIDIRDLGDNALVVTGGIVEEVGSGFYKYKFTNYNESTNYAYLVDGGISLGLLDRYKYNGNDLNVVEQRMTGIEDDIRQIRNFFRQLKDDQSSLYQFFDDVKKRDDSGTVIKEIAKITKGLSKLTQKDIDFSISRQTEKIVNSLPDNLKMSEIETMLDKKIKLPDIKQYEKIVKDEMAEAIAEHNKKIEASANDMVQRTISGIKIASFKDFSAIIEKERKEIVNKYAGVESDMAEISKSASGLKEEVGQVKKEISESKKALDKILEDIKQDVGAMVKFYKIAKEKGDEARADLEKIAKVYALKTKKKRLENSLFRMGL